MNPLLAQIATQASADILKLIEEKEKDILAAIHKMEEEANIQETRPKFNLGFKITVDLDKSLFDCDLSWNIKQTVGISHQIDDPMQEKLPIEDDETKITIVHGDTKIDTTAAEMRRVTKNLKKN